MNFTRSRTSKELLEIDWKFPKVLEIEDSDGGTRASARMIALPRAEALAAIREDDPRPILVMRECGHCKGTDDALLSQRMDNERTKLLTRWFRCVKLRSNVMEDNHTYHNLFAGKNPPHLFLCSADQETVIPLDGQQSQSLLWKDMKRVIKASYRKDPDRAIKALFRVMADYDHLESSEMQLREQLESEIEKRGPKSPKVRSLKSKLAKVVEKKEKAKAEQEKVSDLELRAED